MLFRSQVIHNSGLQGNFGYNAAIGEYGDMIEMGIIDPAKVTRVALQNAASVASMIMTTEAAIVTIPEKEKQENVNAAF